VKRELSLFLTELPLEKQHVVDNMWSVTLKVTWRKRSKPLEADLV